MQVLPVVFAALAITLVACSGPSTGAANGGGTPSGPGGGQGQGAAGGAATCDAACAHYLGCKGADDTSTRAACNADCATRGYTEAQMSEFVQTDCATAVCEIENTCGSPSNGGGGGGGGGGGTGGDCTNCAWDGSSCIWLSPSTGLSSACGGGEACCPSH